MITAETAKAWQVPFKVLLQSSDYRIAGDPGDYLIKDRETYVRIFNGNPPAQPYVDFDHEEVIVVSRSATTGGYSIDIIGVTYFSSGVFPGIAVINLAMRAPTGPATDALTSPLAAIVLPKLGGKHIFNQVSAYSLPLVQGMMGGEIPFPFRNGRRQRMTAGDERWTMRRGESAPGDNPLGLGDIMGSRYGSPVTFTPYAQSVDGGPRRPSQAVITSADAYRRWLGDIDPAFGPAHNHLDGVDFTRECLVAIGLGEMPYGTSVSISSIYVHAVGIMAGRGSVRYSVTPAATNAGKVGYPYAVVKCQVLGAYTIDFVQVELPQYSIDPQHIPDPW